jgi:F-type H+-transporting ATPase subunit gamma
MKRSISIQQEVDQVGTIEGMTTVFESIASIHISQIKDKVISSTAYFNELWNMYTQLRIDKNDFVRHRKPTIANRQALVVVTSEGGLIGDIDDRIVDAMLKHPGRAKADIYVVGAHGINLLARHGVKAIKALPLPDTDQNIDVSQLAGYLNRYQKATVYYQTYVSLLRQEVARIDLFSAVNSMGKTGMPGEKRDPSVISSRDYIFEPSLDEIITYMESVMIQIALGQIILESKLAQYASRFNAMSTAKTKAHDMKKELMLALNRAKRAAGDERTKEVLSGMKVMSRVKHGRY